MKHKKFNGQSLMMACMIAAIVLLDRFIKYRVGMRPIGDVVFRIDPLFEIVHTTNTGAAFSLFSGKTVMLLIVTSMMLLALLAAIFMSSRLSGHARWSMAVLLAGGIGNWVDRVWGGSVTDYIRLLFIRFPVFNLADICITGSVFVLIILLLTNQFELQSGDHHGRKN